MLQPSLAWHAVGRIDWPGRRASPFRLHGHRGWTQHERRSHQSSAHRAKSHCDDIDACCHSLYQPAICRAGRARSRSGDCESATGGDGDRRVRLLGHAVSGGATILSAAGYLTADVCCNSALLCMPLLRPDSCRGSWPPFIRDLAHQPSPSELMRVSVIVSRQEIKVITDQLVMHHVFKLCCLFCVYQFSVLNKINRDTRRLC